MIFVALVFFSLNLSADKAPSKPEFKTDVYEWDGDWGRFKISVTDEKHPELIPIRLQIEMTCKDRRTKAARYAPPTWILRDPKKESNVCKYVGYRFDKATNTMWVEWTTSMTMEGEGECDTKVEMPYYLDKMCAEFNP